MIYVVNYIDVLVLGFFFAVRAVSDSQHDCYLPRAAEWALYALFIGAEVSYLAYLATIGTPRSYREVVLTAVMLGFAYLFGLYVQYTVKHESSRENTS